MGLRPDIVEVMTHEHLEYLLSTDVTFVYKKDHHILLIN